MAVVRMSDEYPNGGDRPVISRVASEPITKNVQKSDTKLEFQPVVSERGTIKKKTFGQKFRETFIAADITNVGDYIIKEILVPTIKDVVVNSVRNTVSMLVYGEPDRGSPRRRSDWGGGPFIRDYSDYYNYGSYYRDNYRSRRSSSVDAGPVGSTSSPYLPSAGNIEIWYPYYPEAIDVLQCLRNGLATHPSVTLSNLYEASRMNDMITPECSSRGWTDLSAAYVKQDGGSGVLVLPPTCYLNGD